MGEFKTDWLPRHKLSVEAFHRLGQSGVLAESDRVELIEGEVIDMSPIGSRHAGIVNKLGFLLREQVGGNAVVAVQNPVRLSGVSEPQPDIALLRWRADFYTASHPEPKDILLIIEVADASLRYDRDVKLSLYARAEIPEVWIVNAEAGELLTFRDPLTGEYTKNATLQQTDVAISCSEPAVSLTLAEIF